MDLIERSPPPPAAATHTRSTRRHQQPFCPPHPATDPIPTHEMPHVRSQSPAPIPPHLLVQPGAPAHLFGPSTTTSPLRSSSSSSIAYSHSHYGLRDGHHTCECFPHSLNGLLNGSTTELTTGAPDMNVSMAGSADEDMHEEHDIMDDDGTSAPGSSPLVDRIRAHAHLLQPANHANGINHYPQASSRSLMPQAEDHDHSSSSWPGGVTGRELDFGRDHGWASSASSSCTSSPNLHNTRTLYESMVSLTAGQPRGGFLGPHGYASLGPMDRGLEQQSSHAGQGPSGNHPAQHVACDHEEPAVPSHEQLNDLSSGLSSAPSSPSPSQLANVDPAFKTSPSVSSSSDKDAEDDANDEDFQLGRSRRSSLKRRRTSRSRQTPARKRARHHPSLKNLSSRSLPDNTTWEGPIRRRVALPRVHSSPAALSGDAMAASAWADSETSAAVALRRLAHEHVYPEQVQLGRLNGQSTPDLHGHDDGFGPSGRWMPEQELDAWCVSVHSGDATDHTATTSARSSSLPPASIALGAMDVDDRRPDTFTLSLATADDAPLQSTSDDQARPLSPLFHGQSGSSTRLSPVPTVPLNQSSPPPPASLRTWMSATHIAGQVEPDPDLDHDDLGDADHVHVQIPRLRALLHPRVDTLGTSDLLPPTSPAIHRRASAVAAAAAVAASAADHGEEDDDDDMDVDEYTLQDDDEDEADDDDDARRGSRRAQRAAASPERTALVQPLADPATTAPSRPRGRARVRINSTGGNGGNATADDWTVAFTTPLTSVTEGWTAAELATAKRRLVRLSTDIDWDARLIRITPHVVRMADFNAARDLAPPAAGHGPLVSCIWWAERNGWYMTSVDYIRMMEGMVKKRFSIDEKNRIRRNMETFRPIAIHKPRSEHAQGARFFRQVMQFGDPKPRKIEKDIKVFRWNVLEDGIIKLVTKWSLRKSDLLDPTATAVEEPPVVAPPAAAVAAAVPAGTGDATAPNGTANHARNPLDFGRDNSPLTSPPPSDPPSARGRPPASAAGAAMADSPRASDNPHAQVPPPPDHYPMVPPAPTGSQQLALQRVAMAMASSRQRTETGNTSLSTVYTVNLVSSPDMQSSSSQRRQRRRTSTTCGSSTRGVVSSPLVGNGARQRAATSHLHLSAVSELDSILGSAEVSLHPHIGKQYTTPRGSAAPMLSPKSPPTQPSSQSASGTVMLPTSPSLGRGPTASTLAAERAEHAHLRHRAETGETVVLPGPTIHLPPPVRLPSSEHLHVSTLAEAADRNGHYPRYASSWEQLQFIRAPTSYGPNGLGRDHQPAPRATSSREGDPFPDPMAMFPPPPDPAVHQHYLHLPRSSSPSDEDPMLLDFDLHPAPISRLQPPPPLVTDPRSEPEDIFSDIYPGMSVSRPATLLHDFQQALEPESFGDDLLPRDGVLFSDSHRDPMFIDTVFSTDDGTRGGTLDDHLERHSDPLSAFLSQSATTSFGSQSQDVSVPPPTGLGIVHRAAEQSSDPLMAFLAQAPPTHATLDQPATVQNTDSSYNKSVGENAFTAPPLSMTARRSAAPPPLVLRPRTSGRASVSNASLPSLISNGQPNAAFVGTTSRGHAEGNTSHAVPVHLATYPQTPVQSHANPRSTPPMATIAELDLIMDPHGNVFAIAPISNPAVASLAVNPAGIAAATAAIVPPWTPLSPPATATVGQSAYVERTHSWHTVPGSATHGILTPTSPQFSGTLPQTPLTMPYVNGLMEHRLDSVPAADTSIPNLLCLGGGNVSAAFDAVAATAAAVTQQQPLYVPQGQSGDMAALGDNALAFPDSGRGLTSDL